MMEAVKTSEKLVNSYQSTWLYSPEDSHHLNRESFMHNQHGKEICKNNKGRIFKLCIIMSVT
jgi:hypothetical protein